MVAFLDTPLIQSDDPAHTLNNIGSTMMQVAADSLEHKARNKRQTETITNLNLEVEAFEEVVERKNEAIKEMQKRIEELKEEVSGLRNDIQSRKDDHLKLEEMIEIRDGYIDRLRESVKEYRERLEKARDIPTIDIEKPREEDPVLRLHWEGIPEFVNYKGDFAIVEKYDGWICSVPVARATSKNEPAVWRTVSGRILPGGDRTITRLPLVQSYIPTQMTGFAE